MAENTRTHVNHYATGEIETIDYIFDKLGYEGGRDYILANILKYASRAKHKGTFDADVEKIRNYAVILQEKTREHHDQQAKTDELRWAEAWDRAAAARWDYVDNAVATWESFADVPAYTVVIDSDGDEWYHTPDTTIYWKQTSQGEETWQAWPPTRPPTTLFGPFTRKLGHDTERAQVGESNDDGS